MGYKQQGIRAHTSGRDCACDQRQPRERRRPCPLRGQSRSSGTAPGAPDHRDRLVANPIASFVTPPTRMRSCPDLLDQGWPRDQLRRPARDRQHRGHASSRPAVRRD